MRDMSPWEEFCPIIGDMLGGGVEVQHGGGALSKAEDFQTERQLTENTKLYLQMRL